MRVKIYDYSGVREDNSGTFDYLGERDLTEALPKPNDEQALAYQSLRDHGQAWIGGGASPLIRLERVDTACAACGEAGRTVCANPDCPAQLPTRHVCPVLRSITGNTL